MRRLFMVSSVSSWKVIAATALLIADIEGFWITINIWPSLKYGPINCNVANCNIIGVMAPIQPLYYAVLGVIVLLGVAGLALLAYILSLLEKRLAVRDDFRAARQTPTIV
jgi:hypothetical protein